jgi:hypothetical protein
MTEQQKESVEEVLKAFTKALNEGIDPDMLMRRIIERGIELVRGKERNVSESVCTR